MANSPQSYEMKLEMKFQQVVMRAADKKWPKRKDCAEFFVKNAVEDPPKDALRLANVLRAGRGRNNQPRRIKLAEAIKMADLLGDSLAGLLGEAEFELRLERGSEGRET